jgi:protein-tyrosine-phosphatase
LASARKQGYRVYLEAPLKDGDAAARACMKAACAGVVLNVPESQDAEAVKSVSNLRSTYPKLRFLKLNSNGKQPEMRGSIVIKRDAVLEVSSPTAQPWIDTNLALIRVEQRGHSSDVPMYTFSWADQAQQGTLTADDFSLAVAEADAFHADLVLRVDEHLQQRLNAQDRDAWVLWDQVRSMLKFSPEPTSAALQPAANVAVVFDQLDVGDEVLNLLGRHNIPYQVFLAADVKSADLKGFDIVIVLAKPNAESAERIGTLAAGGETVVLVDAHGKYPWQSSQPEHVNEHTTSYTVGSGKVLELSEPVTDPETFAQDIRRLLGKSNTMLSLWNGLTTIAVPYKDRSGTMRLLELVNYAGEPVRIQVQVKGSFSKVRYETPEGGCCKSLETVKHDGFTEFVVPELRITGRLHLDPQ